MKGNEIFIIGAALLAAILLFKGQASSSAPGSIPFISPFLGMLGKAETKAIQTLGSNIETLQSVKESNLGIAQNILDQERSLADVKISQIQTELDKTQSFISQEQKVPAGSTFGINASGKSLLNKFDKEFAFFQTAWTGEKGPLSGKSLFPDKYVPFNEATRAAFAQRARYESAQENIQTANELVFRQQGEIDRLQEEYQTRYGGLSRYG
jgi:hypothetical protein